MNKMIERMARAIDPERWAAIDSMTPSDSARSILIAAEAMRARAAIESMRVPTDEMKHAGLKSAAGWDDYSSYIDSPKICWQAMIDEILT